MDVCQIPLIFVQYKKPDKSLTIPMLNTNIYLHNSVRLLSRQMNSTASLPYAVLCLGFVLGIVNPSYLTAVKKARFKTKIVP